MESLEKINEATRVAYDHVAQRYHDLFHDELEGKPHDQDLLDRFTSRFGASSSVLDAGCGPSFQAGRRLLDQGINVEGVDISGQCVALARRLNPGVIIRCDDMGALPVSDGTYDGVVSYYSIIDTPKRHVGRLFDEFYRLLMQGGPLLIAVKAGNTEGWNEDLLKTGNRIWMTLFTEDDIAAYYRQAGFKLESLERRSPYPDEIQTERIFAVGVR